MITRNILDSTGAIIGTMDFPSGTTEDVIAAALAPYALATPPKLSATVVGTVMVSAVGAISTSSSTPTTLSGMTIKPPSGTYIVQFNGSITTNGASAIGTFGIYVNGTLLPETNRPISCNLQLLGGLVTVSLNAIGVGTFTGTQLTVDGTQTVDIRYLSTNGGTIGFNERVMTLMKVG